MNRTTVFPATALIAAPFAAAGGGAVASTASAVGAALVSPIIGPARGPLISGLRPAGTPRAIAPRWTIADGAA